ncbi:MAG: hypothetical protein A2289_17430 [Deltaproteobacteria bacterium RIFOXYA12_FULL_58_15]|nr:MAG: hypothetical protein A2289_17430 [Deltaproteobacteria bacterium RIFOXYA12_FULL_58_15]
MNRIQSLALFVLAASFACKKGDGGTEVVIRTPVYVEVIQREDITAKLSYVADLAPYAEVRLYSPLPDRIISFPWENGQFIHKGQRVALIRKEGLDRGIEGMIAQADGLDVQIRHLESELKRSKDLLAAGVITRQTFDQIQTSLDSTRAQSRALDANRAQMAATASNAVITAPIDGFIGGKLLQVGDMAAPQIPLASIMQIDKLKAKLHIVESDVAKVKLGHEVNLYFDAFPGESFPGVVTSIMPYLDAGTRTNAVEVTVDNPGSDGEHRLKPRMFGNAELILEKRQGVVVAPEHALLLDSQLLEKQGQDEQLRKAFVVDEAGVAHKRVVRLGARNGSRYEILEGLAQGERLVVRGQHGLKEGAPVDIVTPQDGNQEGSNGVDSETAPAAVKRSPADNVELVTERGDVVEKQAETNNE